jgi:hypothetical protein
MPSTFCRSSTCLVVERQSTIVSHHPTPYCEVTAKALMKAPQQFFSPLVGSYVKSKTINTHLRYDSDFTHNGHDLYQCYKHTTPSSTSNWQYSLRYSHDESAMAYQHDASQGSVAKLLTISSNANWQALTEVPSRRSGSTLQRVQPKRINSGLLVVNTHPQINHSLKFSTTVHINSQTLTEVPSRSGSTLFHSLTYTRINHFFFASHVGNHDIMFSATEKVVLLLIGVERDFVCIYR